VFHPEAYRFKDPVSPHYAAELAEQKVRLGKLKAPETENTLVMEGAGGLLVPYNYRGDTVLDIIKENNAEVIVVSKNYLGSINHTLLTIEALKQAEVPILGIIFNGPHTPSTEDVILNKTKIKLLGRVKEEYEITREIIKQYARDYIFI
jgi:dethiobiotin synthetase